MPQLRESGPYIWVSWIAKLLTGENSCEWAAWFKAQHETSSWGKTPPTSIRRDGCSSTLSW